MSLFFQRYRWPLWRIVAVVSAGCALAPVGGCDDTPRRKLTPSASEQAGARPSQPPALVAHLGLLEAGAADAGSLRQAAPIVCARLRAAQLAAEIVCEVVAGELVVSFYEPTGDGPSGAAIAAALRRGRFELWPMVDEPTERAAFAAVGRSVSLPVGVEQQGGELWAPGEADAPPRGLVEVFAQPAAQAALPAATRVVFEHVAGDPVHGVAAHWRPRLVMTAGGMLGGEHVVEAEVQTSPHDGEPQLRLRLDAQGSVRLDALSRALVGDKVGMVLDDVLLGDPVVMEPLTGGQLSVALGRGPRAPAERERAATALVHVLRSGELPRALVLERLATP